MSNPLAHACCAVLPGLSLEAPLYQNYREEAGWIYAVCEDRSMLVKIGSSGNIPQRMESLVHSAGYHMITLIAAVHVNTFALKIERRIHRLLAPSRVIGEWFDLRMDQRTLTELARQAVEAHIREDRCFFLCGRKVKRRRKALGLTPRSLAEVVGISAAEIRRIESALYVKVTRETIVQLATALHCTYPELEDREPPE